MGKLTQGMKTKHNLKDAKGFADATREIEQHYNEQEVLISEPNAPIWTGSEPDIDNPKSGVTSISYPVSGAIDGDLANQIERDFKSHPQYGRGVYGEASAQGDRIIVTFPSQPTPNRQALDRNIENVLEGAVQKWKIRKSAEANQKRTAIQSDKLRELSDLKALRDLS